jgi:Zn-dependent protease with chaperone function
VRLLYGAFLCGAAVPALGRWLGSKGNPKNGAWILAIMCGLVGMVSLWGYLLLAGSLLEDVTGAEWAERSEPVSDLEGMLGVVLLMLAVGRWMAGHRSRRRLRRELSAVCEGSRGRLVVVAADEAYAFAVPGRRWRILVSEGMLRVLDGAQRRVLFAHERAHLRFSHHRFRAVAQFAATVNPLALPAERAMVFLCERWADEYAAAEVGDRRLTARSLSAAALATAVGTDSPGRAAAFHEHEVTMRVRALLGPQLGILRIAGLVALVLAGMMIVDDFDATVDLVGFLRTFLFL